MTEWRLMGVENPRTGEVHNWIQRDGTNVGLEEVVDELIEMQQDLAECRRLLREALRWCDEPGRYEVSEDWLEEAKRVTGWDDEEEGGGDV